MAFIKRFLWIAFVIAVAAALWTIYSFLHPPAADVSADFAGRSPTSAPIEVNFNGSGGVGSTVSSQQGMNLITASAVRGNRVWAALDSIYAKGDTPDYGLYDQQIARATSGGLDPIVVVSGTPRSLGTYCSMPSNVNTWASMATEVVRHTDQLHPGLRYEIWNEPDSSSTLCTSQQLEDYLTIYGASVPEMQRVAPTAKFGGPALAAPANNTATWMTKFLSDPRTAPYVQFTSFHVYVTGQWDLDHGMDWSKLYNVTTGATNGVGYFYHQFESFVRAGKQPNAQNTPIYIDEYNANWVFKPNCCQNDPVYGPLWNAVVLVIWLNAVNDGARSIPTGLVYFMSGSANKYFCLIGVAASNYTDCTPPSSGQSYVEYPSLLAYQLFSQPDKLDIERGGYVMARPAAPQGLQTAAFFTESGDNLVLVNPTSKDYPTLNVEMLHPGLRSLNAESFVVANNQMIRSPLQARLRRDGVAVTVALPPYATVAVKLNGN